MYISVCTGAFLLYNSTVLIFKVLTNELCFHFILKCFLTGIVFTKFNIIMDASMYTDQ